MEKIYFADFETSTKLIDEAVKVYLWGLMNIEGNAYTYGVDIKDFLRECGKLKDKTIVYFHNISWDGMFIVPVLLEMGYAFLDVTNKKWLKKRTFTWIMDGQGNMYSITIKFNNGNIVEFRDSLKILLVSVDKLGSLLGYPKLEIDYHQYQHFDKKEDVPQELLDYLHRDIDIVRKSFINFQKTSSKIKLTLPSTVLHEFKQFYNEEKYRKDFEDVDIDFEKYKDLRRGYFGGMVLISPKWQGKVFEGKGYSYDVNSMFPGVMKNYKMPYGKILYEKPIGEDYMELIKVFIYHAKLTDEDMPPFLINKNSFSFLTQRFVEEIKQVELIFTKEEFEMIKKCYYVDYDIVETMYFKTKDIFSIFISDLERQKIEAETPEKQLIPKIKLNSLYGKFAQRPDRIKRVIVHKMLANEEGRWDWGDYVEINQLDISDDIPYIPIAIYITSLARVELLKAIYKNKENFLYADTDSMYLQQPARNLDIHPSRFGAWKQEKVFSKFKALKPKCYILEEFSTNAIIRKVAGLSKENHDKLNFDNFERGFVLEDSKLQRRRVKGGVILHTTQFTL